MYMDPKTKERLYMELNSILELLDDGKMHYAKKELEELIQKVYYNQL